MRAFVLALLLALAACGTSDEGTTSANEVVAARMIQFSGYDWYVKDGAQLGPGPNQWSANNVFVDKTGALHLKITQQNGVWSCAEVTLAKSLGWGTYQFEVIGQLDALPPSAVLGLFNYPSLDVGPDGTHEIDIELSHWGDPQADLGNFTVWPNKRELPAFHSTFPVTLFGTYTTHRFEWRSDRVRFQSQHGHPPGDLATIGETELVPLDPTSAISRSHEPVHLNFWLFRSVPPADGQPLEVVVSRFVYMP